MEQKRVSILGCGWFGMALAKQLISEGYFVKGTSTRLEKFKLMEEIGVEPYLLSLSEQLELSDKSFFDTDVLVISIPPNRRGGEAALYSKKVALLIPEILKYQINKVIFTSSTSVYGDTNEEVDEMVQPVPDTDSGRAILAAEQLLNQQAKFKTSILRFSGLIGPGRDPGRFFAGKQQVPNGLAPVNLVHLEDCVGIAVEVIKKGAYGCIFNISANEHPEKMKFYKIAAEKSALPVPDFKYELLNWKIVKSRNVEEILGYKKRRSIF